MEKNLTRRCVQEIPAYIPGKPVEEVERELGISGVIKMASNENPLGPSNEVRQTIVRTADRIALYPDANAYYLKETLTAELGVGAEHLLIGNGLDDVNRILAEAFLEPGDEVIIPQPTFSQYESVTLLMGAKPVLVKGNSLEHDLEAMKAAVSPKTKLIYLCNPNNPTGRIIKRNALLSFLTSLPKNLLVVIDEAYADFADDPDFPSAMDLWREGYSNILIFKTFSKIHGIAGLRLGYAVAAPDIIAAMAKVKDPFNVNLIALAAGIAALGSKKHILLSKELVWEGRRYFYRELEAMGLSYLPTQANFILIHCKRDSQEIYRFLLENGIIVRPTHSFGLPEYIRVTFGTAEQNARFFRAFREGMQKLEGYQ